MFSDLGLKPSVVQSKRGNDPVFLNTAWVTQILRGLLLWLFALIASLLIYYANHVGMVPTGTRLCGPNSTICSRYFVDHCGYRRVRVDKAARGKPQSLA